MKNVFTDNELKFSTEVESHTSTSTLTENRVHEIFVSYFVRKGGE